MDKAGPLHKDEEFFAELRPAYNQKCFPTGRENLSFNMQNMLLNFEADFYALSQQANTIKKDVCHIYKEVFHPPHVCDPCCSCKQNRKSHLTWHATKTPHMVIDSVVTDEDKNT